MSNRYLLVIYCLNVLQCPPCDWQHHYQCGYWACGQVGVYSKKDQEATLHDNKIEVFIRKTGYSIHKQIHHQLANKPSHQIPPILMRFALTGLDVERKVWVLAQILDTPSDTEKRSRKSPFDLQVSHFSSLAACHTIPAASQQIWKQGEWGAWPATLLSDRSGSHFLAHLWHCRSEEVS